MKSKLRKEFEDFQFETEKRLWLLENPPLFRFNERVVWYANKQAKGKCKGEYEIAGSYWQGKPHFSRLYYIQWDNDKCIDTTHEGNLKPAKD